MSAKQVPIITYGKIVNGHKHTAPLLVSQS